MDDIKWRCQRCDELQDDVLRHAYVLVEFWEGGFSGDNGTFGAKAKANLKHAVAALRDHLD